jgi:hypothetical protein
MWEEASMSCTHFAELVESCFFGHVLIALHHVRGTLPATDANIVCILASAGSQLSSFAI